MAGGNYCANCGHPHGAAAPVTVTTDAPVFAGFWLRAGAFAIDQGILVALFYFGLMFTSMIVFGVALGMEPTPLDNPFPVFAGLTWLWVLVVAVPWLYHALFESSSKQATPGKLACGIKLTNLAGERVGFGRASARYFASRITFVIFPLGVLAAIAIPAYQDYTVRTEVTEGLKLAAEYKSRVQAAMPWSKTRRRSRRSRRAKTRPIRTSA